MRLLTRISTRLRRRRAEIDQAWRKAMRRGDVDRVMDEAYRTQAEALAGAIERIRQQGGWGDAA